MYVTGNLKNIIDEKGFTQKAMAEHIGISTSTLNNWLKLNRSLPSEYIIPICEFLDVSPYVLLTGTEPSVSSVSSDGQELLTYYNSLTDKEQGMVLERAKTLFDLHKQDNPKRTIKQDIKSEIEYTFIEKYHMPVSAGTGVYLDSDDKDILEFPCDQVPSGANFALRVSGDSMEPKFSNGDTIFIKTQPTVADGEIGIFILNDEGFIKKFGGDCLQSLNPDYEDIPIHEYDEISCRGKVIGKL